MNTEQRAAFDAYNATCAAALATYRAAVARITATNKAQRKRLHHTLKVLNALSPGDAAIPSNIIRRIEVEAQLRELAT